MKCYIGFEKLINTTSMLTISFTNITFVIIA